MKRQLLLFCVAGSLVAVASIGAMIWSSGYEKNPDVDALFETQAVQLKPDRRYVWLKIHLKRTSEKDHDLMKPLQLLTADNKQREPDNIQFAGNPEDGFTDIWVSFWMEQNELKGKMDLKINDGVLKIKESEAVPALRGVETKVFKSSDWEKSWLGF